MDDVLQISIDECELLYWNLENIFNGISAYPSGSSRNQENATSHLVYRFKNSMVYALMFGSKKFYSNIFS